MMMNAMPAAYWLVQGSKVQTHRRQGERWNLRCASCFKRTYHQTKNLVTGGMSELVIDRLEVIQVDVGQCKWMWKSAETI